MAKVTIGGRTYEVEVRGDVVVVDGHDYPVTVRHEQGHDLVTAGGVPYRVQLPPPGERNTPMDLQIDYRPFSIEIEGRLSTGAPNRPAKAAAAAPAAAGGAGVKGGVRAQIAGRIISVKVKPGDQVAKGDVLLLLEAMKMENEVKAPAAGAVKEVLVAEGARVTEGQALVVIE